MTSRHPESHSGSAGYQPHRGQDQRAGGCGGVARPQNAEVQRLHRPHFIRNKNQQRAGFQPLIRVSDDGYNCGNAYHWLAAVDLKMAMERGTRWRLPLMANRGAGSIADYGGNPIVHGASALLPLGDLQSRFIAGPMPDWSGCAYLQPTLNTLASRGRQQPGHCAGLRHRQHDAQRGQGRRLLQPGATSPGKGQVGIGGLRRAAITADATTGEAATALAPTPIGRAIRPSRAMPPAATRAPTGPHWPWVWATWSTSIP